MSVLENSKARALETMSRYSIDGLGESMAAKIRLWTPEIVRRRIRAGTLLYRLKAHVLGKIEMTPTQVQAAKILLAKCIPDLRAIDISGSVDIKDASELSTAELYRRISAAQGVASPSGSSEQPAEVH